MNRTKEMKPEPLKDKKRYILPMDDRFFRNEDDITSAVEWLISRSIKDRHYNSEIIVLKKLDIIKAFDDVMKDDRKV